MAFSDPSDNWNVSERVDELHAQQYEAICKRQDAVFAIVLIVQWIAVICVALWNTATWSSLTAGNIHIHVWAALLLGASIVSFPLTAAKLLPGSVLSRHSMALGQILFSSLLTHLMNGRIEAHFHVFGSLAFLAFYRDWRVLATASTITLVDHVMRGYLWPESIYGSSIPGIARTLEHGFWVGFEVLFLIPMCLKSQAEMRSIAVQHSQLETEKAMVEKRVEMRTQELAEYGKFLRGVIDGIDAGICILDGDGQIIATNSSWINYGNAIDPEKSRIQVGMNYLEICRQAIGESADGAKEVADNIERILQGKSRAFSTEYPCHSMTEKRWFQVRVTRVMNPDRAGAIVVHLDITQRMKALADLQEQKRQVDRLALVAQYTTNSVMIADSEQRVIWANEGCSRILGSPLSEILNRPLEEILFSTNSRPEVRDKWMQAMADGQAFRSELTCLGNDGREKILEAELQPIFHGKNLNGFIINQTDLTEQASLRERLESIFSAMAEGILVQDTEGRIVDCNPEAETILGASREDLINRLPSDGSWQTVFEDGSSWPFEDHPAMVTLRTGIPIRDAVMGVRQSTGNMRWISINTQVIRTGSGNASSVVSSFTDITTRREQMQRLDLTITGAGLGVWDWNLVTGNVRFNSIFARVLGYAIDEIRPNREYWESLIHPEDRSMARQQLETHLRGLSPDYRCEYRLRNRQGNWQWVLVSGRIVERDSTGTPLRMAGVHVDIANIKEMEARLRDSENRMRLIFDHALDAVVSLDKGGFVLDWNLQAERIFGFTRERAIGQYLPNLIVPDEQRRSGTAWYEQFQSKQSQDAFGHRFETTAVREDGQRLSVELAIAPVRFEGQITYSVFLRDVTQQRQLEMQVSQAQRLESIGQLASGVAHEINTPVQFVNDSVFFVREGVQDLFGLIDQLQSMIQESEDCEQKQHLLEAAAAAQEEADLEYLSDNIPKALDRSIDGLSRVAEIVRSMKEFSHQGSGEMKAVDLNHSIMSTLIVAKNEYKYVADVDTNLGDLPEVLCYGGEVNQVILNLIVNASHAVSDVVRDSGNKGKITIETRMDGEWVEILITDTGTGIPERVRDRIFEPFFTTKEVGKGTGQGLALAHSVIVKKHGGELFFKTEMGKGTTFVVRLPVLGKPVSAEWCEV
ncbi:MAG: PAS domain S-box protein [Pirellulales bacterium]